MSDMMKLVLVVAAAIVAWSVFAQDQGRNDKLLPLQHQGGSDLDFLKRDNPYGAAERRQGGSNLDFLKRDNPYGAAEQHRGGSNLDFLKRDNPYGAAERR